MLMLRAKSVIYVPLHKAKLSRNLVIVLTYRRCASQFQIIEAAESVPGRELDG